MIWLGKISRPNKFRLSISVEKGENECAHVISHKNWEIFFFSFVIPIILGLGNVLHFSTQMILESYEACNYRYMYYK